MPAPFAFPGHYWDEDKGRFFKIEATGTAPPGAPHSQQEVDAYNRRQQLVDQEQQRWNRRRQRQQLSSKGEDASHEDGSSGDVTARCKQHRRQQQQKQQQNRHHQRKPSKRARYASGSGGEPSSSSSPLMAEKIRLTLKRNALDEEDLKFVKNHLIDRHPRYGHEIGKADTGDYNRSFVGSRAARAAAAFAHGLEFKGAVPVLNEYQATNHEDNLFESRPPVMETTSAVPFDAASHYPPLLSETRITCMYVHGEEMNPGAGIVYTNYHEPGRFVGIKGQYIPVNEDGYVIADFAQSERLQKYARFQRTRPEELIVPHPTAICFHEGSRNLIVGSSMPPYSSDDRTNYPVLQIFAPEVSDDTTKEDDVTWQFGRNPPSRIMHDAIGNEIVVDGSHIPKKPVFQLYSRSPFDSVNACVASPQGYDALCIVATDDGLRAIDMRTAQSEPVRDMNTAYRPRTTGVDFPFWDNIDIRHPMCESDPFHMHFMKGQMHLGQPYLSPDKQRRISNFTVTSVDFVHKHPRLVVAAGRHPVPWLVDLRDRNWHAFGGTSMVETHDASIRINGKAWDQDNVVTHVRSAGQYHVVAASLNNKMLMYDLRYMKSPKSSREEDVVAAALFRFRNYHKSSRLTGLGFDVDAELGLVAAAEEHEYYTGLGGGLSLFSLATGERIHAPGLWHVSHSPERLAHIYKPPKGLLTLPRTSTAAGWNGDLAGLLSEMPAPGLFITVASERDRTLFKSLGENVDKQPLPRVGALSFTALPHENTSLFAAVGARVHKFSLKHDRKDMFYGEDEEDMVDEQAHRP